MAIAFTEIPEALLVPGQYQEIDNSLAGTVSDVKRALMIGTMSASGTATAGKAVQVRNADKAKILFGDGSPAAVMAEEFLKHNTTEELWVLPIAEPDYSESVTHWTQRFNFSPLREYEGDGHVSVTINGKTYETECDPMSWVDAVYKIIAVINGADDCPVEASDLSAENGAWSGFRLTAVTPGEAGNDIKVTGVVARGHFVCTPGEIVPGTGVGGVAGALAGAIKSLGSVRYHYIASSLNDTASIRALVTELNDRYTALRQIDGRCFIPLSGAAGDVSTAGTMIHDALAVNCPHVVFVPRGNSRQSPAMWAAAWCAVLSRRLADDPAANTTDIEISDLEGETFSFDDRQALLENGIATYRLDGAGTVLVERVVTSYTENSDGARDTSYLDIQVVETVSAIRTYINQLARKRFKTWKLARTEENFGPGSKVMTPGVWRSFLAEVYQSHFIQEVQWCQDFDSYKDSIIVEVKSGSKTRLEYRHRPVLIGQFYIGAGLNQFQ